MPNITHSDRSGTVSTQKSNLELTNYKKESSFLGKVVSILEPVTQYLWPSNVANQEKLNPVRECPLIDRKIEKFQSEKPSRVYSTIPVSVSPISKNSKSGMTNTITDDPSSLEMEDQDILVYFSKGPKLLLNGLAHNYHDNNDEVWCMHLAMAFALDKFGGKEAGKFKGVNSIESIEFNADIPTDYELRSDFFGQIPLTGYYCDMDKGLGEALYSLAQNLTESDSNKKYLMLTGCHAMAISLTLLKENQGIRLDFYDPNDTARVRRVICPSIESLSYVQISDLIPDSINIELYFPESQSAFCLCSTETSEQQEECDVRVFGSDNSAMIHLLLRNGHLTNTIINDCDKSSFSGKNNNQMKGLSFAVFFGHNQAMKNYVNTVINDKSLSLDEKKKLLSSNSFLDEQWWLRVAILSGNTEAVRTFLNTLLDSRLSTTDIFNILNIESKDGVNIYDQVKKMTQDSFECSEELRDDALCEFLDIIMEDNRLSPDMKEKITGFKV